MNRNQFLKSSPTEKLQIIFSFAVLSLLVGACGGGTNWPRGKSCTKDYNPIELNLTKITQNEKMGDRTYKPEEFAQKETEVLKSEIYFEDSVKGIRAHYLYEKRANGKWEMKPACLSGFGEKVKDNSTFSYFAAAIGIGGFGTSAADGSTYLKLNKYSFSFKNQTLTSTVETDIQSQAEEATRARSPKDVFSKSLFLKTKPSEVSDYNFQIRGQSTVDGLSAKFVTYLTIKPKKAN